MAGDIGDVPRIAAQNVVEQIERTIAIFHIAGHVIRRAQDQAAIGQCADGTPRPDAAIDRDLIAFKPDLREIGVRCLMYACGGFLLQGLIRSEPGERQDSEALRGAPIWLLEPADRPLIQLALIGLHIFGIGRLARGYVHFSGRPIELVANVCRSVRPGAREIIVGISVRHPLGRRIRPLRRSQALVCIRIINAVEHASTLGADGRNMQGRRRGRREQRTRSGIVVRHDRHGRPFNVAGFVMNHAGDICHLRRVRLPLAIHVAADNRRLRALWRLHAQHIVEIVAGLIQEIVQPVTGFRNICCAVLKSRCAALIGVEQRPDADAAIDDIFALVAGIIPSAADIQLVVAARPLSLVEVLAVEAGQHFLFVCRRTGPLLAVGIFSLNRDARAIVIEIVQRVVFQVPEDVFCHIEWVALADPFDRQNQIRGRRLEGVRHHEVDIRAGAFIKAIGNGPTLHDHDPVGGSDLPLQGLRQVAFRDPYEIVARPDTRLRCPDRASRCVEGVQVFLLLRRDNMRAVGHSIVSGNGH